MNTQTLKAIIEEKHLLKHPFYQAWSNGTLPLSVMQKYAIQYYHLELNFPKFLSLPVRTLTIWVSTTLNGVAESTWRPSFVVVIRAPRIPALAKAPSRELRNFSKRASWASASDPNTPAPNAAAAPAMNSRLLGLFFSGLKCSTQEILHYKNAVLHTGVGVF